MVVELSEYCSEYRLLFYQELIIFEIVHCCSAFGWKVFQLNCLARFLSSCQDLCDWPPSSVYRYVWSWISYVWVFRLILSDCSVSYVRVFRLILSECSNISVTGLNTDSYFREAASFSLHVLLHLCLRLKIYFLFLFWCRFSYWDSEAHEKFRSPFLLSKLQFPLA